ncbi:MAG: hypothetical protein IJL59_10545 [Clostridia bacterium]|nr:hypothetical protein [Clostridia bacterium]
MKQKNPFAAKGEGIFHKQEGFHTSKNKSVSLGNTLFQLLADPQQQGFGGDWADRKNRQQTYVPHNRIHGTIASSHQTNSRE